jgi:hypothetical protein
MLWLILTLILVLVEDLLHMLRQYQVTSTTMLINLLGQCVCAQLPVLNNVAAILFWSECAYPSQPLSSSGPWSSYEPNSLPYCTYRSPRSGCRPPNPD